MNDAEEREDLGPCCACRGTEGVRNILMLPKRGPVPGAGWGCLVCHLPSDGAIAVLCDTCLEEKRAPLEACHGYPGEGRRVLVESLSPAPFEHDNRYHPETWKWYRDREEVRPCSLCGLPIPDEEVPILLFRGKGRNTREARFHEACHPIGKGLPVETFEHDRVACAEEG